jgi:hypothetical protein
LKKTIAIFLVFTLLSQVCVNVGIGIYYHINKAYIVQKLCENRNKPQLHCNGHCFLSKQLKKAEEGENKSAQLLKEKEEQLVNPTTSLSAINLPSVEIFRIRIRDYQLPTSPSANALIKPPALLTA